jgi:multisubunit Na+/H+ antiporter MnhE subunit
MDMKAVQDGVSAAVLWLKAHGTMRNLLLGFVVGVIVARCAL